MVPTTKIAQEATRPAWCATPDCHGDHYSAPTVLQTLEPDSLEVSLTHAECDSHQSTVLLGGFERDAWWDLTPQQAQRLAQALTRMASAIDHGGEAGR